ncbi:MAG: HAD family hydrolase, partial [Myxococcota bacterium]
MKRPGLCLDATGTLIEASETVGEVYHQIAMEFGVELPAWRLDDAFRRVLRRAPPRGTDGNTFEERRQGEVEWWTERIRQTFQATDSTARFDDFGAFAAALFDSYRQPGRWRPRTEVVATLRELAQRGFSMVVVSN